MSDLQKWLNSQMIPLSGISHMLNIAMVKRETQKMTLIFFSQSADSLLTTIFQLCTTWFWARKSAVMIPIEISNIQVSISQDTRSINNLKWPIHLHTNKEVRYIETLLELAVASSKNSVKLAHYSSISV